VVIAAYPDTTAEELTAYLVEKGMQGVVCKKNLQQKWLEVQ
jgi:hypothetical protein